MCVIEVFLTLLSSISTNFIHLLCRHWHVQWSRNLNRPMRLDFRKLRFSPTVKSHIWRYFKMSSVKVCPILLNKHKIDSKFKRPSLLLCG